MELEIVGGLVVVIMAFCQALKVAGLQSRWIPLLAVVLGIAGGITFGGNDFTSVIQGIMAGLSSSGLFDLGKKTVLNK